MRLILTAMLLLCIGMAFAMPSDEVKYREPSSIVSLSNVDPATPKLFASQDGNLTAFQERDLPDLGRLFSGTRSKGIDFSYVGQTESQTNFTEATEELPEDIGNATNATDVVSQNGTLIWY